jgi:sterol desaturase/sphingolipid hydroxylase (fatty acid hydroxylase superfamily)
MLAPLDWLIERFSDAQQWLFETVLQPAAFAVGLGGQLEEVFTATGWMLVGLIQIAIMLAVIAPLQRWRPVEPVQDRAAIRTDVLYTLIHRLGLFRVAFFLTLEPLFDELFGLLRVQGLGTFHLEGLWPGVTDNALVAFVLYLVVFDFIDYWIHRGQHHFEPWWALHSLHHSQRQMTMWSDNRNHLLDDVIRDILIAVAAQLIGVAPGQFVAVVAFTQLSESLQHANLRLSFGRLGDRLWISPRYHRLHHSIGIGHESGGKGTLGGHNFGVLLPWWDMLFGTVNFDDRYDPTGIRDQVEPRADGSVRDYGRGFWAQQWLGLRRLVGRA